MPLFCENNMTLDTALKESVISRDRKAQLELYTMCFDQLMGVAKRYKNNLEDSQTLVNNAFIKIVTNLDKYEDNNFNAWVKRIIMNEVVDDYRKQKKYNDLVNLDYPIDNLHVTNYGTAEHDHSEEALLEMVANLPNATRHVFNLFVIDGFSHKEICEQLNISMETSKWHMKEARKRLKFMLSEQLVDERG
jgi:RNA polymerase sigma factor (sigma-70 family)